MSRWLLAIALASSQLLLPGHTGMYVCMGSDGAFCLEADPETCTCCKEGRHKKNEQTSGCCSCSKREMISSDLDKTAASGGETFVANENDCGCLHLKITGGQSRPATRAVHSHQLRWDRSHSAVLLPTLCGSSRGHFLQSLSASDFTSGRLSCCARCLVMRC